MKKILSTGILFLATQAPLAAGFPDAPSNRFLNDGSGAKNAISMSCKRDYQGEKLNCDFIQMTVSYELDPKDFDKTIAEEIQKINTDDSALGKDPIKEVKKFCFSSRKDKNKISDYFREMSKGPRKEYAEKMLSISDGACTANSISDVRKIAIKLSTLAKKWETMTCKVRSNSWSETFVHHNTADAQYWVTKSEPQGDCGVINVSTLKKDGAYFWNYESKRIVTNKEGKTALLSCNEFEDRTVKYTWNQKEHDVNCKVIKFTAY